MPRVWVRRLLGFAVVFDAIAIALLVALLFGGGGLVAGGAYLFVPWFPMGMWGVPLLAAVAALSLAVAVWRSRVSAVLLLVLYLATKLLLAPWLYVLGTAGMSLWLAIAAGWALCFAVGVVGTVGYHRLPEAEHTPRSRAATIAGAVAVGVLVVGLLTVVALQALVVRPQLYASHTVEYHATSSGDAHVRYSSKSFGADDADFTQTWVKQISVQGSQDRVTLDVEARGTTAATVSCAILWDGAVLDEDQQTGVGATASCSADRE